MSTKTLATGTAVLVFIGLLFVLVCFALAWPFTALGAGTKNWLLYEEPSPDGRHVLSVSVTTTQSRPRYYVTILLRHATEQYDFLENKRVFGIQDSMIIDPRWESSNRILIRYQGAVAKKPDDKVGEIEVETRRVSLLEDEPR